MLFNHDKFFSDDYVGLTPTGVFKGKKEAGLFILQMYRICCVRGCWGSDSAGGGIQQQRKSFVHAFVARSIWAAKTVGQSMQNKLLAHLNAFLQCVFFTSILACFWASSKWDEKPGVEGDAALGCIKFRTCPPPPGMLAQCREQWNRWMMVDWGLCAFA